MEPLVTVIIPVCDVEPWLGAALESVAAQTHKRLEALMVNDGSTDGSRSLCEAMAARDGRFRLIDRHRGGQSVTRNAALEQVRGEYIAMVDGDDLLHPRALQIMLEAMIPEAQAVMAPMREFPDGDAPALACADSLQSSLMSGAEAAELMLRQRGGVNCSACGKLWRASVWRDARFREGILYEDLDLVPRITWGLRHVVCLDSPLYGYRQRAGSTLHTFTPRRLDVIDVTRRLLRDAPSAPLRRAAAERHLRAAVNMLRLLRQHGNQCPEGAAACLEVIRHLRRRVALDGEAAMSSRLAAAASCLGLTFLTASPRLSRR